MEKASLHEAGQAVEATGVRGGAVVQVGLMAEEPSVAVARVVEAWVAGVRVPAVRAASLAVAAMAVVKGLYTTRHHGWQRSRN